MSVPASRRIGTWSVAPLALLLAGAPASAVGQDLAVTGGTVHTVSGEMLEGATVLILDGYIVAVGVDVDVPTGVASFDATGRIVTPGLFDITTSVGLVEVGMVGSTVDFQMQGDAVRRPSTWWTGSTPGPSWSRSTVPPA